MRDLTLITKKPLEMDKCLGEINKVYTGAIGNEHQIHLGKPPKSLYIWFPSLKKYDPSEYWDDEEMKDLPEDYLYFTSVEFHLTSVSKKAVKALESLYPDMIIEDENGLFYTIEEYVNAEFDF